jgi:hypothetical protein
LLFTSDSRSRSARTEFNDSTFHLAVSFHRCHRRCFALGQIVREASDACPEPLRVAIPASGSFSLDIGGPFAPPGQLSGVADPAWVDEVLGCLRRSAHEDLLNATTTERLVQAGKLVVSF